MAGPMATMILAVTTRATLGHTGRELRASAATVLAYVLVVLAGMLRVAASFDGEALLQVSAASWILGWLCFLIVYVPICVSRGAHGRPC